MTSGIYALIDPRDNKIHYVGASKCVEWRLQQHKSQPSSGPKEWLLELRWLCLRPRIVMLEEMDGDMWARERRWIAWAVKHKQPITNKVSLPWFCNRGLWRERRCTKCGYYCGYHLETRGCRLREGHKPWQAKVVRYFGRTNRVAETIIPVVKCCHCGNLAAATQQGAMFLGRGAVGTAIGWFCNECLDLSNHYWRIGKCVRVEKLPVDYVEKTGFTGQTIYVISAT